MIVISKQVHSYYLALMFEYDLFRLQNEFLSYEKLQWYMYMFDIILLKYIWETIKNKSRDLNFI